jgi:hypothetical protein
MPQTRHAVAAVPTDQVTLATDDVADPHIAHLGANLDDLAGELMAEN